MPEDTTPAATGNTTTTPATPASSTTGTTAPPSTGAGKSPWTVTKLSAEELSDLERKMQLDDPATVVLPGGKTLKEIQDAQRATQVAESAAEAKKEKPLPDHSSTVMETQTAVAVNGETGQVIAVPLVPPPTEETKPQG